MLGDRLPDSLAAYYAALDEGAFEQAAAAFSEDVVYAVPRPGAHEVGARNVVEGRQSLREYFERRGVQPHQHRILLSAVEGSSCLLEGVTEEAAIGRALRTFMATLQLGAQELITRYLAYQCKPPMSPGHRGGTQGGGRSGGPGRTLLPGARRGLLPGSCELFQPGRPRPDPQIRGLLHRTGSVLSMSAEPELGLLVSAG